MNKEIKFEGIDRDGLDWDYLSASERRMISLAPSFPQNMQSNRFQREMAIRAALDNSLAQVALAVQTPYLPELLIQPSQQVDFNISSLLRAVTNDYDAQWTMHKPKTKSTYSLKRKKKTMRRNKK
jgi:hypothetical protein